MDMTHETAFPTIISFYTQSWEYAAHADRLRRECDALGLLHHIQELPDRGSWIENTRLKATYIHASLVAVQRPVLWIDVDGSIHNRPLALLLPTTADFAGRHQRTGPQRTWHVGTMFFNYTSRALELAAKWRTKAEAAQGTDEAAFEDVWLEHARPLGINYAELPAEYFVLPTFDNPHVPRTTVISHRLSQCESKLEAKTLESLKA